MGVGSQLALFALLVAVIVAQWCSRLPSPYHSENLERTVEPSEKLQRLLPGNVDGPKIPLELGRLTGKLKAVTHLFEGKIHGSESAVVFPSTNELVMIDKFGFVHMALLETNPDNEVGLSATLLENSPPFYIGPGRPLGMHAVDDGSKTLIVCDSLKGLLRVSLADRTIVILSNSVGGVPFHFCNDVDVAADGTIYFTASTDGSVALNREGFYDTMYATQLHALRANPSGQLLRYDPITRQTTTLMSNLFYANGVAVSADGSFLVVAETFGFRILRYQLTGSNAGDTTAFVSKLPGTPDGVSLAADGNFWVAIITPATPFYKLIMPFPRVRQAIAHVIHTMAALVVKNWGYVLKISAETGEVLEVLDDLDGSVISSISAVTEHNDHLFFGNLQGDCIGVLKKRP
eukprot:m.61256 g.61256  ORF g.61256 m.61256 type:complete len:404 (+) comp22957_c0_seq1:194-1405(+)